MLKNVIVLAAFAACSINYGQYDDHYRLSNRSADSIAAYQGGNDQKIVQTSFDLNRKHNNQERANKNIPKELKGYRLISSVVSSNFSNGKKEYTFTHTYNWFMKGQYYKELNKIVIDTGEDSFKITRAEAIAKLKEAKELLDLDVISQKEYDELKAKYSPIITG